MVYAADREVRGIGRRVTDQPLRLSQHHGLCHLFLFQLPPQQLAVVAIHV